MIDDIKAATKTWTGKILAILAVSASGLLGDATDLFTNWSSVAEEDLAARVEALQAKLDELSK